MDKRIEEIRAMSEAMLSATNHAEEERARLKTLDLISTMDFTAQQSDNLGRRQTNTGEWFLENTSFRAWATGPEENWALFCPGAPGAGKTTMAATIISSLSGLGLRDDIGIAYVYCNYRSRSEQTLYNLLGSLLRRLVQIRSTVPQCIHDAFKMFSKDRRLTLQECTNLIASVYKASQRSISSSMQWMSARTRCSGISSKLSSPFISMPTYAF
jgi:Cdc6-like AAA superfamily ATPase